MGAESRASFVKNELFNLCQADKEVHILALNPDCFCGPVAVINTLLNKYQKFKSSVLRKLLVNSLITKMSRCMKTQSRDADEPGTKAYDLIQGLMEFSQQEKLAIKDLDYRSWFAGEIQEGQSIVTKEWLEEKTKAGANIILQLGWYCKKEDEYRRVSGHYVTFAGIDDEKIYINDPAKRALRKTITADFKLIDKGRLINKEHLEIAQAYMSLTKFNFNTENGANTAIIDGAISYRF